MKSALSIATVILAILAGWYAAAALMNASLQRDAYANAGRTDYSTRDLIADSLNMERPKLPLRDRPRTPRQLHPHPSGERRRSRPAISRQAPKPASPNAIRASAAGRGPTNGSTGRAGNAATARPMQGGTSGKTGARNAIKNGAKNNATTIATRKPPTRIPLSPSLPR